MFGEVDMQCDGDWVFVWIVKDGKLYCQFIVLGECDDCIGEFVVKSGLFMGSVIICNLSCMLVEGIVV